MALDKYHLTKKGDEWRMEKAGSNRAVLKGTTKAETIDKVRDYMSVNAGVKLTPLAEVKLTP
ncbi:MAG: DUF2188 domain-containing protein [Pseudomonadales bacterium]